jgi:hypothetical protein
VAATLAFILAGLLFASSPKFRRTLHDLHKRTLTLDCGSIDYQRHIDHGDTNGACVTPTGNQ